MSDDDRTEPIQVAMSVIEEVWQAAFEASKDPTTMDAVVAEVSSALAARLIAAGVTPADFAEADALRWQMRNALQPLEDERFVKLAYLVKHAPGKTIADAIASLSDEELAEFQALTGDDL